MTNSEIINVLGGTSVVAKLCNVSPAAVSMWRNTNIPADKMLYLAATLEKSTEGVLNRRQMFPNTYKIIWPELH